MNVRVCRSIISLWWTSRCHKFHVLHQRFIVPCDVIDISVYLCYVLYIYTCGVDALFNFLERRKHVAPRPSNGNHPWIVFMYIVMLDVLTGRRDEWLCQAFLSNCYAEAKRKVFYLASLYCIYISYWYIICCCYFRGYVLLEHFPTDFGSKILYDSPNAHLPYKPIFSEFLRRIHKNDLFP